MRLSISLLILFLSTDVLAKSTNECEQAIKNGFETCVTQDCSESVTREINSTCQDEGCPLAQCLKEFNKFLLLEPIKVAIREKANSANPKEIEEMFVRAKSAVESMRVLQTFLSQNKLENPFYGDVESCLESWMRLSNNWNRGASPSVRDGQSTFIPIYGSSCKSGISSTTAYLNRIAQAKDGNDFRNFPENEPLLNAYAKKNNIDTLARGFTALKTEGKAFKSFETLKKKTNCHV